MMPLLLRPKSADLSIGITCAPTPARPRMWLSAAALAVAALTAAGATAAPAPTSTSFTSRGEDRQAIEQLLANYTRGVSTQDEALFESILLDRDIPFSYVGPTVPSTTSGQTTHQFESFRKGVFNGKPKTQKFSNVRIEQDGNLAQVSLVFKNDDGGHLSWGFKTLQLLKVGSAWKIASEFFTIHDGAGPDFPAVAAR